MEEERVLGIIFRSQFLQLWLQINAFPAPRSHPNQNNFLKKNPLLGHKRRCIVFSVSNGVFAKYERVMIPVNDNGLGKLVSLKKNLIKMVRIIDGFHLYGGWPSHIWPRRCYFKISL
jgi:hypothetical protein